ncbi:MAG: hypothetical protein WKG00_40375 [Polyangiaceae bacterium]
MTRAVFFPVVALALALPAPRAQASVPSTIGAGARSMALARADVADAAPLDAGEQNAASAAEPGVRLRLGYSLAALGLTIDERQAGLDRASGIELGLQAGWRVGTEVTVGLALSGYVPHGHIARVVFRPVSEPQLVRYEAALARTVFDAVAAFSFHGLALGGGLTASLDVEGGGTDFELGQDGGGTRADAATDIELPYRLAPLVAARADLGPVKLGARFAGEQGVGLGLRATAVIALVDNPLDGSTTVRVDGVSGWQPARLAVGARFDLPARFAAHVAFEYSMWSAAPAPVANVDLDVDLRTSPELRQQRYGEAGFVDTFSPRVGLELEGGHAPGPEDWRWVLRAGYALSPTPVPPQRGQASWADATTHVAGAGAALRIGDAAGVDLVAGLGGQLSLLAERTMEKPNPALPFARYQVGGHIVAGALTLEGTWR